jgi:hypothetical protein
VIAPPPTDRELKGGVWYRRVQAVTRGIRGSAFHRRILGGALASEFYSTENDINLCPLIWIIFWADEVYLLGIATGHRSPAIEPNPRPVATGRSTGEDQ